MESGRLKRGGLTAKQYALLEKYDELILHPDQEKLIKLIDRLTSIPEEFSPIRELVLKDDISAIEHFFEAAAEKIKRDSQQALVQEMQRKMLLLMAEIDNFTIGRETSTLKSIDLESSKVKANTAFLKLVMPIYRDLGWGYGFRGDLKEVESIILRWKCLNSDRETDLIWVAALKGAIAGKQNDVARKLLVQLIDEIKDHFYNPGTQDIFIHFMKIIIGKTSLLSVDEVVALVTLKFSEYSYTHASRNLFEEIIKIYHHSDRHEDLSDLWSKLKVYSSENDDILVIVLKSLVMSKNNAEASMILARIWYENNERLKKLLPALLDHPKTDVFEYNKMAMLEKIFNEHILRVTERNNINKSQAVLFELIKGISLENDGEAIKRSILVDCLYESTLVGRIFWSRLAERTPSLQRGVLNEILQQVKNMNVNIAKLPGFENVSVGHMLSFPRTTPSKKDLEGKSPPQDIPLIDIVVRKEVKVDHKNEDEDTLKPL